MQRILNWLRYRLPITHRSLATVHNRDGSQEQVIAVWRTRLGGGIADARWYAERANGLPR